MRTSLIATSIGAAALAALTVGIAPSQAEPVAQAYPYCLLGRSGGSTTCYFRTRAECGGGCINNPGYVGDKRAREILAGIGVDTGSIRAKSNADRDRKTASATKRIAIDPEARASAGRDNDFAGWPTGYLINRFGDHQAQGRF